MVQISSAITRRLHELLTGDHGLPAAVQAIGMQTNEELPAFSERQVFPQNLAPEMAERVNVTKYPQVHVYCDRMSNDLREKFRRFSGRARLVVEVRVSQDRIDGLERQMQLYVEATTAVLELNRGDWGGGAFYPGRYEVTFGPVKHGGKNFLQVAKIALEIEISSN
jgi:hypothetical protein